MLRTCHRCSSRNASPWPQEIGRQPQMKETKQSVGRALSSLWKAEMEEDGSVVLWCELFNSHLPHLTPNEAFALLDFLYELRDVLCRQGPPLYRPKPPSRAGSPLCSLLWLCRLAPSAAERVSGQTNEEKTSPKCVLKGLIELTTISNSSTGFRLRATEARAGCSIMPPRRRGRCP
jgi:hypothetical protein